MVDLGDLHSAHGTISNQGCLMLGGWDHFFWGDWLLEPLWVMGTAGFNVNPRIMSCFFKSRLINLRGSPKSDVSQLNRSHPYFQPTRAINHVLKIHPGFSLFTNFIPFRNKSRKYRHGNIARSSSRSKGHQGGTRCCLGCCGWNLGRSYRIILWGCNGPMQGGINGAVYGKIYKKTWILPWKLEVFCRCSLDSGMTVPYSWWIQRSHNLAEFPQRIHPAGDLWHWLWWRTCIQLQCSNTASERRCFRQTICDKAIWRLDHCLGLLALEWCLRLIDGRLGPW